MNFKKLLSRLTLPPGCLSHENGLYLFLMLWIGLGLKILYETVQRELLKECFAEMAVVRRHISMKFHRINTQEKGKRCSEEKLSINALILNCCILNPVKHLRGKILRK